MPILKVSSNARTLLFVRDMFCIHIFPLSVWFMQSGLAAFQGFSQCFLGIFPNAFSEFPLQHLGISLVLLKNFQEFFLGLIEIFIVLSESFPSLLCRNFCQWFLEMFSLLLSRDFEHILGVCLVFALCFLGIFQVHPGIPSMISRNVPTLQEHSYIPGVYPELSKYPTQALQESLPCLLFEQEQNIQALGLKLFVQQICFPTQNLA